MNSFIHCVMSTEGISPHYALCSMLSYLATDSFNLHVSKKWRQCCCPWLTYRKTFRCEVWSSVYLCFFLMGKGAFFFLCSIIFVLVLTENKATCFILEFWSKVVAPTVGVHEKSVVGIHEKWCKQLKHVKLRLKTIFFFLMFIFFFFCYCD